jgi:hypothetical protein
MSGESMKGLGFRGAMLAVGMMLGTAGTALAGSPDSTQDKQKWVEHQKRVETKKTVEAHKSQPSRWDTRADDRRWADRNAHRRYEEQRERLEQRAEARQQRYQEQQRREAERRRQLARRYEHQKRHEYGTGGSGYSHPHDSWKRHGDHKNHHHRADGSCDERKYDGKRRW